MQIKEKTYEITTSQYDYGVPIEGDTDDLIVDDTLAMLNQMGVETDDQ